MAVTFDNAANSVQTATASLTIALTVTSGAVLMVFAASQNSTEHMSAIAANGNALTKYADAGATAGGTGNYIELWVLTAPPSGVLSISANATSAAGFWEICAVSYVGAAGTNPFGGAASATATTVNSNLSVSSTTTDLVVCGISSTFFLSATNMTQRSSFVDNYTVFAGDKAGVATTTSLSAVIQGSTAFNIALLAVPLHAAIAATTVVPLRALVGAGR